MNGAELDGSQLAGSESVSPCLARLTCDRAPLTRKLCGGEGCLLGVLVEAALFAEDGRRRKKWKWAVGEKKKSETQVSGF